jgi:hypothetical protein
MQHLNRTTKFSPSQAGPEPPTACAEKLQPPVPQKREPSVFSLESLSDADPQLPKPRGKVPEKKSGWRYEYQLAQEKDKLARTFQRGGLVPERSSMIDTLSAKAPPKKPICVPNGNDQPEPLTDPSI